MIEEQKKRWEEIKQKHKSILENAEKEKLAKKRKKERRC
ncbi:MAG: hypothetical protein BLITH_1420 [Brockia lithotrophica]|uniref:Uncharacterized protein n=1 Tax=Brockia lithotrophica TaxID=933949 RepID=A0A2T5G3X9_9BACL|nr:MAG: hypothetical protein BLITH_1420 [Brockia lithotrophica]